MCTTLFISGLLLCAQEEAETPSGDKVPAKSEFGAAVEADSDLAPLVRKLVRELDAPEKARRDAAQQKLLELGALVLDLLPETTDKTSAEVRMRLDKVRSVLERTQAESAIDQPGKASQPRQPSGACRRR